MTSSDDNDELARELRIYEGIEVGLATPRIVAGMFLAFIVVLVHAGPGFFLGPIAFPAGVIVIMLTLASRNYFKVRHKPRPKDISHRRIQSFTIFAVIMGIAWGAAFFIMIDSGSRELQIAAIALAFIGTFGTTNINSIRVVLGFGITSLVAAWAAVLWTGLLTPFEGSVLFALAIVTIGYFAQQAFNTTIANIKLTLANTHAMQERFEADEKLRLAQIKAAELEQQRQIEISSMQRNMINAVPFPMVLTRGDTALEVTPQARNQFKLAATGGLEEFLLSQFFVDPKAQKSIIATVKKAGKIDDHEMLMKDADGDQFWVTLSIRPLMYEGKECWLNAIYVIDARKRMEQDLEVAKEQAEAALADLKTAQASLVHAEKMASLGQLTAGIAHEIKNPLNFVNNFSKLSAELLDELAQVLKEPIQALDEETRDDAEDLLETVRGNLLKIDEHGKRADSIVKNMLLHSREGTGERQIIDLNPLAQEAMNLAYHGARASDAAFNVDLDANMSDDVGTVEGLPQELQRVILNLCSNGMYAAVKQAQGGSEPAKLTVASRAEGSDYLIEVTDNGGGIPDDIRDKVFQPFFTTKPTGEGTGLGLSMSYDIVKQHGGELTLESAVGTGTTFTIRLPKTDSNSAKGSPA